ncbi:MAG: TIGR00725 family protein [Candidatus Marinimicrobia bacterium]|nr:TIGR00725 family protein [Candidatus Neomarinimicrobiota bacterium]
MITRKPLIAVFGGREADEKTLKEAELFGQFSAEAGWIILCGGKSGVMEAVCRGVAEKGGLSIGLLPESDKASANEYVTISIATGLGYARNEILALACDAACAFGGKYGTLSEIAHTLNFQKPVASVYSWNIEGVHVCQTAREAFLWIKKNL